MSFYSENDRNNALKRVSEWLEKQESVLAVILVGSGAKGFRDRFSDIDLTAVLDENSDVDGFLTEYQEYLNSEFDVMINHRVWGRPLAVAVLDNLLEIDISAVFLHELRAVRESWKVLSDRSGQAEKVMQDTWSERASADTSGRAVSGFNGAAWGFWHYLMYAALAVKRGDLWRACWEIQYVRDMIVDLTGLESGVETKRYRDVGQFPVETLARLEKTFPAGFTQGEFARALKETAEFIYDILEERFGDTLEFPRDKMKEYFAVTIEGI